MEYERMVALLGRVSPFLVDAWDNLSDNERIEVKERMFRDHCINCGRFDLNDRCQCENDD